MLCNHWIYRSLNVDQHGFAHDLDLHIPYLWFADYSEIVNDQFFQTMITLHNKNTQEDTKEHVEKNVAHHYLQNMSNLMNMMNSLQVDGMPPKSHSSTWGATNSIKN